MAGRVLYFVLLSAVCLAALAQPNSAHAADPCGGDAIPGEYIIKFRDDALTLRGASPEAQRSWRRARIDNTLQDLNVDELKFEYDIVSGLVHVRADQLDAAGSAQARQAGVVEYIEPNCRIQLKRGVRSPGSKILSDSDLKNRAISEAGQLAVRATPNDPRYDEMWGLHNTGQNGGTTDMDIDAPEAWDLTTGSSSVVVAIVDSGVDYNHEDLNGNMWVNTQEVAGNGIDDDNNGYVDDVYGINAVSRTGDPQDDPDPHGTHVAGTVGAIGNNNTGVTGINWSVKIMAVKILDSNGGSNADALRGLQYVLDMKNRGENVVTSNNSWGYTGTPPASLTQAVQAMNSAGIGFVAAAGNEGLDNDAIPDTPSTIDSPNVISVAAANRSGNLANFSHFGATTVDFAAPGVRILSTVPSNQYTEFDGTSMAAPHVAGIAALIAARNSSLSPSDVRTTMINTVTARSGMQGKMVAAGIVNAAAALASAGTGGGDDGGSDGGDGGDGGSDGGDDGGDDGDDGGSQCNLTGEDNTVPTLPSSDTDGDGVSDADENSAGTNINDPGSYPSNLASPVFALWSGFLNMTNILELINVGNSTVSATVTFFTIDGSPCSSVATAIGPGQEQDIIINDMAGFTTNSHGLIKVEYTGGSLDGRVSYYRQTASTATGAGIYDFAYNVPLSNPRFGTSAISFNSNQPSLDGSEASNLVANWLSIVNLTNTTQSYTLQTFGFDGSLLDSRTIAVSAKGRVDVEAGHVSPGPGNVGMHKITPANSDAAYIALLIRYGYDVPGGETPTNYTFAFPLVAVSGNGETTYSPLTTTVNAQNWLELLNFRSQSTSANVRFYRSDGSLMDEQEVSLAGHAQRHFNVNGIIGDGQTGYAEITPSASNSFVAQSMVYIRDTENGRVLAMYGSQAREAITDELLGTYNLFLSMANWLKLLNPSGVAVDVDVTANLPAGSSQTETFTVPARGSVDIGLHDANTFGTSADTFGVVEIDSDGDLISELLRIRVDSTTGKVDFATPTEVR